MFSCPPYQMIHTKWSNDLISPLHTVLFQFPELLFFSHNPPFCFTTKLVSLPSLHYHFPPARIWVAGAIRAAAPGTHNQLLALGGTYAQLVQKQMSDRGAPAVATSSVMGPVWQLLFRQSWKFCRCLDFFWVVESPPFLCVVFLNLIPWQHEH